MAPRNHLEFEWFVPRKGLSAVCPQGVEIGHNALFYDNTLAAGTLAVVVDVSTRRALLLSSPVCAGARQSTLLGLLLMALQPRFGDKALKL